MTPSPSQLQQREALSDITMHSTDAASPAPHVARGGVYRGGGHKSSRGLSAPSAMLFAVVIASSVTGASARGGGGSSTTYPLNLKNLYVSHGVLNPSFEPAVFSYEVRLQHAHDEIAVTPEIFQELDAYEGKAQENLPLVTIHWAGHMDEPAESASVAVRKQIDLPDDKGPLDIEVRVSHPNDTSQYQSYHVTAYQSGEPLTVLKGIEGSDEWDNTVLVEPVVSQDDVIYSGFVHPDATTVMLTARCATLDWLTVNGASVDNGTPVPVVRDKRHHKQIVEISCGEGQVFGKQYVNRYILALTSDFPKDEILPPKIIVDDNGRECKFDQKGLYYSCPDPRSHTSQTRVIGFIDPSIRYTVESPDEEVMVRVLDQTPTIPFTYRSDLVLKATAGRFNQTWPLHFNAPFAGGAMRIAGYALGGILFLLLSSLAIVLVLASIFGLGSPMGSSEIAHALTYITQYFCFANFMRGHNSLSEMTSAVKWTTGFMPLPWETGSSGATDLLQRYRDYSQGSQHYSGDIGDVHNAFGSVFWCGLLFVAVLVIHGGVLTKFKGTEKNNTLPHRLQIGHWESRILHILTFPMCTAATIAAVASDSTILWRCIGAGVLLIFVAWAAICFSMIRLMVANKKVTWIWNSSVREDGELEDESGYWSDVQCDQLNTQPVNRSPIKNFFPWTWVSTVADIEAVNISPELFNRRGDEDEERSFYSAHTLYPQHQFREGANYPMGKNPKQVEVWRTRAPGIFCPGQRLIAGLLRTQWLDVLFTYQALSRFHTQVAKESAQEDFVVPMTVKTCQLQGPLTTGPYCHLFDGARVPFIRIADILFKIGMGVCIGVAIASKSRVIDVAAFTVAAIVCCAIFAYAAATRPFSRSIENYLFILVVGTMGLSSFSFGISSLFGDKVSIVADIFLWIVALSCILLAAYSCVVVFSVFSAVSCPPMEETRFLEKLANCAVTISDHTAGWAVDMPAYNKLGAKDIKAQCNWISGNKVHASVYPSGEEPSLEFSVEDIKQACRTGSVRAPCMVMYAPGPEAPLKYRHRNFFDRESAPREAAQFLSADRTTAACSDEVARHVKQQLAARRDGRGGDKNILTFTVVPPREAGKDIGSSYGRSISGGSDTRGTSRRSRRTGEGSDYSYSSLEMSRG